MKRREFLTIPKHALGGVLLYTLAREPFRLAAAENGNVKVPLRFFSESEARVISAACDRIFPSDQSGPGAKEAGVVIYIDRQLAGPWGRDKYRYTKGPWIPAAESAPEHGYQGPDNPQQIYRAGIKTLGENFAALSPDDQDKKLESIEKTRFFALLRTNTIEGMFCDPAHGGNVDLIGWQLIGYPGPRMSYGNEVDKHYGTAFRPKPMSLEQIAHRKPSVWEDEKS